MGKYSCTICGYVYDEAQGTAWAALPEDWVCPICGATKAEFRLEGTQTPVPTQNPSPSLQPSHGDIRALSSLELSALCSNLARGCEKQYKPHEAALFTELAAYFKAASAPQKSPEFDQLLQLIEKDIAEGFVNANAVAAEARDRGALRALVWSEKVTRILKSLLNRYQREGDAMLENTGVYVCTICGFVYVGDSLPEACPVCKVPNWKFEKVEGR